MRIGIPPSNQNPCINNKGFTLIELSIVLVIIGLIIGGVLVGRDLIKSSELRAQIQQIETFKTAANTFRSKYNYLPGDIPPTETAQLGFFTYLSGSYIGKQKLTFAGPPFGSLVYAYGDNNGNIDDGEQFAFWQHLTEAKMIAGQYGITSPYLETNTNLSSGGYPGSIAYDSFLPPSKLSSYYSATYSKYITVLNNHLVTAQLYLPNTSLPNFFSFYATPNQEYYIDNKLDDGLPDKGTIRDTGNAWGGAGAAPCMTAATPNAYDLTKTTADTPNACQLKMLW